MKAIAVSVWLVLLSITGLAEPQTKADQDAVRRLPEAFRDAFNNHDRDRGPSESSDLFPGAARRQDPARQVARRLYPADSALALRSRALPASA
jgi:hypothetical protein